jgi:hypothetical protein
MEPAVADESTSAPWPRMPYQGLADPRWAEMNRRDAVDKNWQWKMAINFYGKAVDQSGQVVSEARVDFAWNDLSSEGTSRSHVVTDGQGGFTLTGQKGKILQVDVSKDGYYKLKSERLRSFEYADFSQKHYHEPDPGNPVLFHLVKKGEGEALLTGNVEVNAPANGAPVRVDLLNGGRISAEGQVEIAAVTSTLQYPPRFFDWRATIAAPGGGLVEKCDELGFAAPIKGYLPRVEFNFPASAPDWKRSVRKSYYIRFGHPAKYGRVEIDVNGGKQLVFLRFVVNPSGSRNLEPQNP